MTGGARCKADDPADEAGFRRDQAGVSIPVCYWRYAMSAAPTHWKRALADLACVHPNAAGLDIGSEEIVVAIPPARDSQPVRVFQTFTADLHALVAWLIACGIDTVNMESTGGFCIPFFVLLDAQGIAPYLVNGLLVEPITSGKTV